LIAAIPKASILIAASLIVVGVSKKSRLVPGNESSNYRPRYGPHWLKCPRHNIHILLGISEPLDKALR
jgi:hypothetical protein